VRCQRDSSGLHPGLFEGSLCFDGEESAGASFLRQDGTVWTTDKDGPIMDLLAAEITARTGKDPGKHFTGTGGGIPYTLLHTHRCAGDTPTERKAREAFAGGRQGIKLAGETISAKLTGAPGNDAPIDGLKVVAPSGWFAARASGTAAKAVVQLPFSTGRCLTVDGLREKLGDSSNQFRA
jgi:phosphoglucomutase